MQKTVFLLLLSCPLICPQFAAAQTDDAATLKRILDRLDAVEKQNARLMGEIQSLRMELAQSHAPASSQTTAPQPTVDERLDVIEARVEEQAQTKVESSQRMPLKFSGIALFNTFLNSEAAAASGGYSTLVTGPDRSGATIGQSQLGISFRGPELPGNGRVSGLLDMDFLGGSSGQDYALRIRRGIVSFDWDRRSLIVGQDKPLISTRQPDSLAEVAYPPLAAAGNPWLWQPQVRYVEHFRTGASSGIDAEGSLLETAETSAYVPSYLPLKLDPARPALEGRLNLWHSFGDNLRFEIAPGFHVSDTHVNGYTVPSRFATIDWNISPARWLHVTGLAFGGRNMASLGGFADGFTVARYGPPIAVHGFGGWSQLAFTVTPRLTLNTFCGLTAPRSDDLAYASITHTASCAANAIYRIAPNVLVAAEALQERTGYVAQPHAIRNHYDLAIGYLF